MVTPKDDELIEAVKGIAEAIRDNPDGYLGEPCAVSLEAAASRIAELKAALKPFADFAAYYDKGSHGFDFRRPGASDYRKARRALSNPPSGEVS